jgi:putative membrane protein insertion efficiency factor
MVTRILVGLIRTYKRIISPLFPNRCRFHPTCSEYAIQSLQEHGPLRGLGLAFARIGRCHPFHPGGVDPVPRKRDDYLLPTKELK